MLNNYKYIKSSRFIALTAFQKIASTDYVETLFEESPDSPDYFDSMQKLLLKSDNKNIIFYIDDELGEGVEAKVFKGYFEGKEVAVKLCSKPGSVDKYRKLLDLKASLPNNWGRYIPNIYFMEKNIKGRLFSVTEDLIDPSLIDLDPYKLTNYIDELIIMEINNKNKTSKIDHERDLEENTNDVLEYLIDSVYTTFIKQKKYLYGYTFIKDISFDKEKIYQELYNSKLSFRFSEDNKIADIISKNIKIYFKNNYLILYDLAFKFYDIEDDLVTIFENAANEEYFLQQCKYLYQNILTSIYHHIENLIDLGYIDHDSVKKYFQKATHRGYSDFADFLDYLKENYGIIAADLHSDNIMLNPKTDEYQLTDIGHFKFEDDDE